MINSVPNSTGPSLDWCYEPLREICVTKTGVQMNIGGTGHGRLSSSVQSSPGPEIAKPQGEKLKEEIANNLNPKNIRAALQAVEAGEML